MLIAKWLSGWTGRTVVCLSLASSLAAQDTVPTVPASKPQLTEPVSLGAPPEPGEGVPDIIEEETPEESDDIFSQPSNPDSPLEILVRQGQTAYGERRYEDCINLMSQVLSQNPLHSVARYQRASAQIDLGRLENSNKRIRAGVADAREALSQAGKKFLIFHVPYFYGLTSLAEIERKKSHAELTVSVATPLLTREDLPINVKGMVYYQRGLAKVVLADYKGAAADFGLALEIDPVFKAAHFARAEAFAKNKENGKALECFDRAVASMPDDPLALNNRGTFQLQQGRLDAAISDFGKALEIDPLFAMAALNRGFAYSQRSDYAQAERDYIRSIAANPRQPLAYRLLGTARVAMGKLPEAIDTYSQLVSLSPQESESYAGRGFARFFARDYRNAAGDFARAIEINSEYQTLTPWLYWSYAMSGQAAMGRQAIQPFLDAQAGKSNWHATLCRYLMGEIDDATLIQLTGNTSDSKAKSQWMCEARFFLGLKSESARQATMARQHYEACLSTKQSQLTAFLGAKLALQIR